MGDVFPPDAVLRRVNGEPGVLLGAGRALVLQLAHPAVAQGVADHSSFRQEPFRRLQGTFEALHAVVYGSEELATAVAQRVRRIHRTVVGPGYRAGDPDLLLWVHATLVDTALRFQERFVGPLPPGHAARYYEEMTTVAALFGLPRAAQPATLTDFRRYVEDTMAGLEVSPAGRELAAGVLDPVLPRPADRALTPLLPLHRLVTVGTIPERLRRQLGWRWTASDAARLGRLERGLTAAARVIPAAIRGAPNRAGGLLLLRAAARRTATGA